MAGVACFDVSVVVIVGDTEPAAVAGGAAPPASPATAPAPSVSQPFRVPFEHAPTSTTLAIATNRISLCIAGLRKPFISLNKAKSTLANGERAEFMSVFLRLMSPERTRASSTPDAQREPWRKRCVRGVPSRA